MTGVFNTLKFSAFPATYPQIDCLLELSVPLEELEERKTDHQIRLTLTNPAGQVVQQTPDDVGWFQLPSRAEGPTPRPGVFVVPAALQLQFRNLRFDRPGDFALRVDLDNTKLWETPVLIEQA